MCCPVNVIHDREQHDRLPGIIEQLFGIPHIYFPAVRAADFATGCAAAHKAVVRHLQARAEPYGIVAEDDLRWTAPGAWGHFLAGMAVLPPDWDIYLGGISSGVVDRSGVGPLRRVSRFTGLHLYAVSARCYTRLLGCPSGKHLDVWLGRQSDLQAYLCWPMAAVQAPGWSANRQCVVDDSARFAQFELWGGQ